MPFCISCNALSCRLHIRFCLESVLHEHPLSVATCGSGCRRRCRVEAGTSDISAIGVVVVETPRLEKVERLVRVLSEQRNSGDVRLCEDRADEQCDEGDKHGEVQNRVANDTTSAELRLLERVYGRADLTAGRLLAKD